MPYIPRLINKNIQECLKRGKSVLLLGPRQTGKTTFVEQQICPDISYSFVQASVRQRYERNIALLEKELLEKVKSFSKPPIVFIDEIQKIPSIMDTVQYFVDNKLAQFVLSGSSARKLKHSSHINLLPGRVVSMTMSPFLYDEFSTLSLPLEDILLYGTLPGVVTENVANNKEIDLNSYVTAYLEEEVRAEALVRNIGSFSRFLEVAAGEAGKQVNFSRISQDIGITDTTIANYYQILEDCLIIHRIDPITQSSTKRRLIKSPKYLFFDLGIRRACANEGIRLPQKIVGDLFEHYVGNELIYQSQLSISHAKVRYWRDSAGPEIDYVLDVAHRYVPIEVKWSDKPNETDIRHIKKFLQEYSEVDQGYVVCRTPHRYKITSNITALPWQEINFIFENSMN